MVVDLQESRKQIDEIDRQIVELYMNDSRKLKKEWMLQPMLPIIK